MRIQRIISRTLYHLGKVPCKIMFYFNHRIYMRMYIPLLKKMGMHIGGDGPRYIGIHVSFDSFEKIYIGERTTISDNCRLLTHDYSITNAFRAIGKESATDIALVREIHIGKNCFIGTRSIILPNCNIGDNCIVGAGSVVRGNIPDNSLVIGNPSQVIGTVNDLAKKWMNVDQNLIRRDK